MIDFIASPWIPTVVLLLLACGARVSSKSWLAPGPFALLTWSVYLVIPLALAPEYKVSALGVWLILLLVGCIAIGADFGAVQLPNKPARAKVQALPAKSLLHLSLFLSGLSLLGVFYSAGEALSKYSLDFSIPSLLSLGHLLSVERYAGEQPPFLVRVLIIWVFAAALLGGMIFAKARTRTERFLCLIPLFSALMYSVIQAAKANTLIVIALGLGGYLAMRVALGGSLQVITRKSLLITSLSVILVLSLFFGVDAIRSRNQNQGIQLDTDWGRAESASLGYLAVFSHWADSPEGPGAFHLSLGSYTIGGLLDVAGLHSRNLGVYSKSVSLDGNDTNIYTAFRGLIEDFSLPGAMIVCFLLGFLSGRAYKHSLCGSGTSAVWLAGFYAFLLWSPIVSLFYYNGPILAMLVGALAVRKVTSANRQRGSASLTIRPLGSV